MELGTHAFELCTLQRRYTLKFIMKMGHFWTFLYRLAVKGLNGLDGLGVEEEQLSIQKSRQQTTEDGGRANGNLHTAPCIANDSNALVTFWMADILPQAIFTRRKQLGKGLPFVHEHQQQLHQLAKVGS